jgi:uncharacterized protein YfiM (DUF2279 family)
VIPFVQFLMVFQLCAAAPLSSGPDLTRPDPIWPVQEDRWIAEDKLKHAFTSIAAVNFAYAGARLAGFDDAAAIIVAATSGAAAGIWKEIHDHRAGRSFSGRDLLWDGVGLGLGVLLVSRVR